MIEWLHGHEFECLADLYGLHDVSSLSGGDIYLVVQCKTLYGSVRYS